MRNTETETSIALSSCKFPIINPKQSTLHKKSEQRTHDCNGTQKLLRCSMQLNDARSAELTYRITNVHSTRLLSQAKIIIFPVTLYSIYERYALWCQRCSIYCTQKATFPSVFL